MTASTDSQSLLQDMENLWLRIGIMYEGMHLYDRAIEAFRAAVKANPYSVESLTRLASIYTGKGDFSKASTLYQRVLNVDNRNGTVWYSLGYCFLKLGQLQKAYFAYQKSLHYIKDPKDPLLWLGIGILYENFNSNENAREAFRAVIKIDPSFDRIAEARLHLGVVLRRLGEYDEAYGEFEAVSQAHQASCEVQCKLEIAITDFYRGNLEASRDVLEGLRQSSSSYHVLLNLALLYALPGALQDLSTSASLLKEAMSLDNSDPYAWYLLGRVHVCSGQHSEAYKAYQQAVYREDNNPAFWCSIGSLYYQINQYRDSLDAFSRAIQLNGNIPVIWKNLGILYEACNGQQNDAVDAYEKAVKLLSDKEGQDDEIAALTETINRIKEKGIRQPGVPGEIDLCRVVTERRFLFVDPVLPDGNATTPSASPNTFGTIPVVAERSHSLPEAPTPSSHFPRCPKNMNEDASKPLSEFRAERMPNSDENNSRLAMAIQ